MFSRSIASWFKSKTSDSYTNLVANFDTWITVCSLKSGHSNSKYNLTVFVDFNRFTQPVNARLHDYIVNLQQLCVDGSGAIWCRGNINLLERDFKFRSFPVVSSFVWLILWHYQCELTVCFNDIWLFSNDGSLIDVAVSCSLSARGAWGTLAT